MSFQNVVNSERESTKNVRNGLQSGISRINRFINGRRINRKRRKEDRIIPKWRRITMGV